MWRLILAILLLLLSLLVFFRAPTNFFWRVAIAITEFPYIPILVSVVLLLFSFNAERFRVLSFLITSLAMCLFIFPIIKVYFRGGQLKEEFGKVFPFKASAEQLARPFSLLKLVSGIGAHEVTPETYAYKTTPEKDLTLDFYRTAGSTRRPCIVVIHGGSWSGGDSKQLPDLNFYLSQHGYHVAAINYHLAPAYKSPAQVKDLKEALAYLVKHAEKLAIDTSNFILLGRSAGAQIALMGAYTFHDLKIKGVISFYGPADMVWGARIKSNKLVLNTDQVFRNYFGGLIDEVPAKYQEASAINFVSSSSPPTLLIHGYNDAMVSYYHSARLEDVLIAKQVPCYFLNLRWATHGCDYNINGPSGQISTYSIERFINSVTRQ